MQGQQRTSTQDRGPRAQFSRDRLEWIRDVEETHFWHAPRFRLLLGLVERHLEHDHLALDVGCGSGRLVDTLRGKGHRAFGTDPHAADARLGRGWACAAAVERLPYRDGTFSLVSALDVLEHVDDRLALAEIARVLHPGGVLVVSVPAYGFLWSERDVRAGHRRRYDRGRLRDLLRGAGFQIDQLRGYQLFLLPLMIASRLRLRASTRTRVLDVEDQPAPWLNALLRAVNSIEVALGRWLPVPTGSSLVAVARRSPPSSVHPA